MSVDGTTLTDPTRPVASDSTAAPPATTPGLATGVSTLAGVAAAAGAYTSGVRAAFMLGWSMAELKGRIQAAAIGPGGAEPAPAAATNGAGPGATPAAVGALPSSVGDAFWLASAWRINFTRVSLLHAQLFPENVMSSTPYDPGPGQPPYLYPGPPDDYADAGLSKVGANGKPVLDGFALCEATRRALNCLALLYTDPALSLPGCSVAASQAHLIQAIPGPSPASTPTPSTSTSGETTAEAAAPPSADGLPAARAVLTRQTLFFLEAWDAYLHESFFACGLSVQDEARLVAYEAGRAMANLSWAITVATLPEEAAPAPGAAPASASAPSAVAAPAGGDLHPAWQTAFRDQDVSRLQRQLAVLATGLDNDAVAHGHPTAPSTDAAPGFDPTLPGTAVRAVIRSLDHWQRAIHWLGEPGSPRPSLTAPMRQQMRLALVEQIGIWQALVLGQEDLRAHTARNVVQQIQQDVISRLQQVAAQEGIVEVAADAGRGMRGEVGKLLVGLPILVYLGVAAGLLAIVGLGAVLFFHGTDSSAVTVSSILVALAGGLGLHQASTARTQVAATGPSSDGGTGSGNSLAQRMSSLFGSASGEVLQAFEQGYKRIQVDLADLGHAVAVTAPLVEYFVLNDAFNKINDDYHFLTEIIWSNAERREEVMRVAAAAFGPIGLFAQARFHQSADSHNS